MTTITCTATTRLSADECLARLAACPALPRGERPAQREPRPSIRKQWFRLLLASNIRRGIPVDSDDWKVEHWRRLAAPLRKAREQRQQYRRELSAIASCYTDDPYCQAHCTWHDWPARARKALGIKEEREPYSTEWEEP